MNRLILALLLVGCLHLAARPYGYADVQTSKKILDAAHVPNRITTDQYRRYGDVYILEDTQWFYCPDGSSAWFGNGENVGRGPVNSCMVYASAAFERSKPTVQWEEIIIGRWYNAGNCYDHAILMYERNNRFYMKENGLWSQRVYGSYLLKHRDETTPYQWFTMWYDKATVAVLVVKYAKPVNPTKEQ